MAEARVVEWLGPERIYEAYGGTERIAGTMISGTEWLAHPGSVGKPTLGRKVRILDADGKDCGPREVGEVFMMPAGGRGSTYRYLGAQAAATADGWESLGDMGYLDEDGYLYLVERKTDMIVTGGANVYPAEVEGAIDAHPGVRSARVGLTRGLALASRVVDAPAEQRGRLRAHLAIASSDTSPPHVASSWTRRSRRRRQGAPPALRDDNRAPGSVLEPTGANLRAWPAEASAARTWRSSPTARRASTPARRPRPSPATTSRLVGNSFADRPSRRNPRRLSWITP